jgi:hypothetical protein
MRALQFWILLLGSSFVSVLLIKQIFLSRDLNQEHRLLVDSQETASSGPAWEKAWQQVAMRIYRASRQDPVLAGVLKNENVEVHTAPPANPGAEPDTTPAAPSASSKAPVVPLAPATP